MKIWVGAFFLLKPLSAWVVSLIFLTGIGPVLAAGPSQLIKNLALGEKQHLVTYGTSLTAGGFWVRQIEAELEKEFPGQIMVTNSGSGGMWSTWGVENLQERILDKHPDTVIIEFAMNDAFLRYKTSVKEARRNLETMIDRILRQNPDCEVILMTMNPPVGKSYGLRPGIEKYYQMYRDVARARKLLLVDHYINWKKILDTDRARFDTLIPDGVHPNTQGSQEVITPELIKALGL